MDDNHRMQAEKGQSEFFKGMSENLANNMKRTYDAYMDLDLQSARQRLVEQARINALAEHALQNAIDSANFNRLQLARHVDLASDSFWNPVSSGAGMNLTAGAVPANRATDIAASGTAVTGEAVSAAVAKQADATVGPVIAVLQQLVETVATMNASIANVIAQAQPQTTE